jgi:hypothetical protein
MWWQNCKMKLVMAGVVVMVLFIIAMLICFSGGGEFGRRCGRLASGRREGGTRCLRTHLEPGKWPKSAKENPRAVFPSKEP